MSVKYLVEVEQQSSPCDTMYVWQTRPYVLVTNIKTEALVFRKKPNIMRICARVREGKIGNPIIRPKEQV